MALGLIKQIRHAITNLNPEDVRLEAERPLSVGIYAPGAEASMAMEAFFCPPHLSQAKRARVLEILHAPGPKPDIEIYDSSMPVPKGGFVFDAEHPLLCIRAILKKKPELELTLARHLEPFRDPVVRGIVSRVAKENALFSLATALPDVLPLISLPWAIGEFASDTAFLTMNQVRMTFLIAAASDHPVGYGAQRAELASILAGAFGFRAIARELIGKIPYGGGLLPKAGIAYAGTRVVGLSMSRLYKIGYGYSPEERKAAYEDALDKGKEFASGVLKKVRGKAA